MAQQEPKEAFFCFQNHSGNCLLLITSPERKNATQLHALIEMIQKVGKVVKGRNSTCGGPDTDAALAHLDPSCEPADVHPVLFDS